MNQLNGGPGDDIINGGTGNDDIFGDGDLNQGGNDTLNGGGGVDLILGFSGDDTIDSSGDGEIDTVNAGPHNTSDLHRRHRSHHRHRLQLQPLSVSRTRKPGRCEIAS